MTEIIIGLLVGLSIGGIVSLIVWSKRKQYDADIDKDIDRAAQERRALQSAVDGLRQEYNEKTEALKEISQSKENAIQELNQLREQKQNSEIALAEINAKREILQLSLSDLSEQVRTRTEEYDELTEKQRNLLLELNQLNESRKDSEIIRAELDQITGQRAEAQAMLIQLNTQKHALELELASLCAQKQSLQQQNEILTETLESQKSSLADALSSYSETLDKNATEKDAEYDAYVELLKEAYETRHNEILTEIAKENAELEKIRMTRKSALEAQLREQEIKEQKAFYSVQISDEALHDIPVLESIKQSLANPRILSMLIWQTWYQKPINALCNNVLGSMPVCGIYKITNQITNMCYIGQARDVAGRWKEHAKCSLGIDTPAGNKLYKAAMEYGLHNFTFELLEACPQDQLNEKEREYIELYDSMNYGYNSNSGIKK